MYKDWSNQDLLSLLSPPNTPVFPPGTQFSYSNSGYYLLGMILETATGMTVSDLFQEYIAIPVKITHLTHETGAFFTAQHSRLCIAPYNGIDGRHNGLESVICLECGQRGYDSRRHA